ncbi:MAG TPA: TIGR04255 family protein [Longimicrobium sp.]|nr:TIGR04255 family protein [Longimicrobium sp.]
MTTLAKAPLIEVGTQFRWGPRIESPGGDFTFDFPPDEQEASREALDSALRAHGFTQLNAFAPELEDVPFAFSREYRRIGREWPVIQTGLGVAAIHQSDEDYDWQPYKQTVLDGFVIISEALGTRYLDGVPYIGVELTYLDGFPLATEETPEEFLKDKLDATLTPPKAFLQAPFLKPRPNVASAGLNFEIRLEEPPGVLVVELQFDPSLPDGSRGFAMETRVRTVGPSVSYTSEGLQIWLDLAHRVQKHAFETLIKRAYRETFR